MNHMRTSVDIISQMKGPMFERPELKLLSTTKGDDRQSTSEDLGRYQNSKSGTRIPEGVTR